MQEPDALSAQDAAHPAGARSGRLCLALLLAASLGVIALAYWYLFHAPPLADDFFRAWQVERRGIFHTAWSFYLHWEGRWPATLLELAYSRLLDPTHHYALTLTLLSALPWLLAWSAARLVSGRRAWGLTVVIFALTWVTCPQVGEGYYWSLGVLEYTLPLALGLALLVLLRGSAPARPWAARLRVVAVTLLAMVGPAGHEVLGALVAGVVLLDGLYAAWRREPRARLSLWAAAWALASWVSVAAAPGNWERFAIAVANKETHSASLGLIAWQFKGLAWHYVSNTTLLCAALLFMARPGPRLPRHGPAWWVWASPLLAVGAYCFVYWAGTLILQVIAPGRLLYGAHLVAVTGLLFCCELWRRHWDLARLAGRLRPGLLVCLLSGAVLLSLAQQTNLTRGLADMGRLPAFRAGMAARFEQVRAQVAGGRQDVVVGDDLHWPPFYARHLDLYEGCPDYINLHWSLYFKARSVRAAPRP